MIRRKLLLLLAEADHPQRDAVSATLAWAAAEGGRLFECYFAGPATGTHFGGGHPALAGLEQLRGGTFTGGHHLEQFYRLLVEFEVEAALLGETPFNGLLENLAVPVIASSPDVARFYREALIHLGIGVPDRILLVGDGGHPQGVPLSAFAYPEIVNRRVLALAERDPAAIELMRSLRCEGPVETLWLAGEPPPGATAIEAPAAAVVSEQTGWMADRWQEWGRGYLLADPELAARWLPHAVRDRLLAVFGIPQRDAIDRVSDRLSRQTVVLGRQQEDEDFLKLSRAGVAFQLIDPARPAFPSIRESGRPVRPALPPLPPIDDAQLEHWASEGKVLTSLLFWTGMIRELENLYALTDALALTRLAAGLILTTASLDYMTDPPLSLLDVSGTAGGLAPRVEVLLASGGAGAFLESMTPIDRFAATLKESVDRLACRMGGRERMPAGWWGVMDATMRPVRPPRFTRRPDPPYVQLRYPGRKPAAPGPDPASSAEAAGARRDLRSRIRESPLGELFQPLRPFDAFEPGPPGRAVLEAVRDAGFEYALTKAAFGPHPTVVTGAPGLTVINHTVGRWDGWTPFVTVNTLADLRQAERKLLRGRRPGWLLGTLDTCLWAFSGPRWDRGPHLLEICRWVAEGGSGGQLVNVPPRVVARYAQLLAQRGVVASIAAR